MIQYVSFRNFKALRDVEVPLERLTVIVGPNSSGKTSILQGLDYLLDLISVERHTWTEEYTAQFQLYRKGARDALELEARLAAGAIRGKIQLRIPSPDDPDGEDHASALKGQWVFTLEGQSTEGEAWLPLKQCPHVCQSVPRSVLVRFAASQLAQPHYSEQEIPQLGHDGAGLPSVLAAMALTYPDEFSRLQSDLKKVIPAVQRIRFERAKVLLPDVTYPRRGSQEVVEREYVGDAILFDVKGARSVPAAQVSEGTLLVLGLLTALHVPPQPNLLLLDDLGAGLHPRAQLDLVAVLRQIMDQRPDLQIVATTHSPYLLNSLRPQEVRLTTLREDGSVACASMTEHPDFERWKAEFRPGEFWSVIGEKWVANQDAKPVEAGS